LALLIMVIGFVYCLALPSAQTTNSLIVVIIFGSIGFCGLNAGRRRQKEGERKKETKKREREKERERERKRREREREKRERERRREETVLRRIGYYVLFCE